VWHVSHACGWHHRPVAARDERRRLLLSQVGGIAIGLVALAVAFVIVLADRGDPTGVTVDTRDGLVTVRISGATSDPKVIESAARSAGLHIAVEAVATGPSLVGRFVRLDGDRGSVDILGRDGPAFNGFAVPSDSSGAIALQVGRAADDDEAYEQLANAMSKGEPLACSDILGADPTHARDVVRDRHLDARWTIADTSGLQPVDGTELGDAAYSALRVRRALSVAPGQVLLYLTDGSHALPTQSLTAPAAC
jgi:hypothetical protein